LAVGVVPLAKRLGSFGRTNEGADGRLRAVNWRDAHERPPRRRRGDAVWKDDMAKGQLRSNREKKKPKADKKKSKISIPASWAPTQFLPTSTRPSTGKKTS
jgi:hypothetical protein